MLTSISRLFFKPKISPSESFQQIQENQNQSDQLSSFFWKILPCQTTTLFSPSPFSNRITHFFKEEREPSKKEDIFFNKSGEAAEVINLNKGQLKIIYNKGLNNEEIHEGSFKDGLLEGKGTITWPYYCKNLADSSCPRQTYRGIFHRGKLIEGSMLSIDGTLTTGFFYEEGSLFGRGSLSFPNGGGYEGVFEDGIFIEGKRTLAFGKGFQEGTFNEYGDLVTGKEVDENGVERRILPPLEQKFSSITTPFPSCDTKEEKLPITISHDSKVHFLQRNSSKETMRLPKKS